MNEPISGEKAAFPWPKDQSQHLFSLGVNLRDYFAAAALQGLLSSIEPNQLWCGEDVAVTCYRTADTMLKAREAK
jgi:hypothetical protein